MCNLLPNYQVTPDCSETYETDSEFAYSENKDIKSSEASRQKSKQNKESNPNTKSPLKTINYKSKLSQHNSIIKPSSHSKFDHNSSTSSSKKLNFNKKFSSSVLDRWESNQFALADANSLIIQLNKELKDCKLELKTLQRQYKMQAVRLDKAIGQEADMPQIVDRLNSEIRTLQVRLREKTLQSCIDQRKIHELQQRIYVLEKTIDEKHNQSQYTDEGSSVSHKRNNKTYDISIELQEEKKRNSQLKHQLDVLTKNHKQQINMNNEKLRSLRQEYQHLKDKLHERTQQLQEKKKLLELQNVYSHRIPKNLILSHLSSLSSIYSTTNEMDNHNGHKEETSKSNNPLIDQYKCNSNDKYSPRLPPITVNDNNNNKVNNDVSLSSQYVTMCKGLEQMPRIDNNIESNLEGYPLMINGKLSNDNEHHVDEIEENSSKGVIGNHQSNDFNLQNNKENTGKTREEELWNDLFGSIKDNVNKTSEVINQHQSSNNGILFSNNSNIINASIHNSNWKTGINQRNNNNNDQDNLKDTFKQPSWLTFHKTVNELSNESNMINNRNSFNRLIDHNITAQLDNIDNDIEVLQI
ncbi:unnamed protein product [Schistosoma intercalatum]|nr:unnamed protein product [Schistosoma intercalatum]CAH8574834.1 unnamed protein product [Schistosoma intercalatum]